MISEDENEKSLIENYYIIKDYFIVEYVLYNKNQADIMKLDIKFDYLLTLIKDKNYFVLASVSLNNNSIFSLYNDENYLSSGYYDNRIVYLDNDLNVVDIGKNKY